MRARLLYDPYALLERLALSARRHIRRRPLKGTPAAELELGHIESLELLQHLAQHPPQVIHDIGANTGTWTCLAKSLYPASRVEAFEPQERFAEDFGLWTASWPDQIKLHRIALGKTAGEASLHITNFADASSLLPLTEVGRREFKVEPSETTLVPVARLDDLVARGHVAAPDLLKLDVQGFELEVLKGAEKCLRDATAVICEISTRTFYEGQPLAGDLISHLEHQGYRLHALGANLDPGQPFAQTDALFIKL